MGEIGEIGESTSGKQGLCLGEGGRAGCPPFDAIAAMSAIAPVAAIAAYAAAAVQ
jgi:hypothetical protein